MPIPDEIPIEALPNGERRLKDAYDNIGITHVHDFYFLRTLHVLNDLGKRLNLRVPDHESDALNPLYKSVAQHQRHEQIRSCLFRTTQ